MNLSKKEIDGIIAYEAMAVENILKVLYKKVNFCVKQIQEYKINEGNVSMINQSKNEGNMGVNSQGVNKNKPANYLRHMNDNVDNNQVENLKRVIDEHQNIIEHLKISIDVKYFLIQLLEMKFKNSQEIENKLKKKVKELVDKLRSAGVNEQF